MEALLLIIFLLAVSTEMSSKRQQSQINSIAEEKERQKAHSEKRKRESGERAESLNDRNEVKVVREFYEKAKMEAQEKADIAQNAKIKPSPSLENLGNKTLSSDQRRDPRTKSMTELPRLN